MSSPFTLRNHRRERGVALLSALVIIGVTAGVATRLMRGDMDAYARFEMMIGSDQARQYALAAERVARELLRHDRENSEIDHLGESWAETGRVFPVETALVSVRIVDLQGLFNLNSISGPDGPSRRAAYDQLERLLDEAGGPSRAAVALREWLQRGNGRGAQGVGRADQRKPTLLRGASELRLVSGMTASVYQRLRRLVTALPDPTRINVNTSPAAVLKTLAPGINDSIAKEIVGSRTEAPFLSPEEFRSRMAEKIPSQVSEALVRVPITVSSSWFLVDIEADAGSGRARVVSVVRRGAAGEPVSVLMRLEGRP